MKDVSETVRAMIGPTVLSTKDGHQLAYNGRSDLFWAVLPDGAFRCLAEFDVREFVDSIRDEGLVSSKGGNERLADRIFANDPNPFTNVWKARYGYRSPMIATEDACVDDGTEPTVMGSPP